jgi:hypothetical protein
VRSVFHEDMYVNECINRSSGSASLPTSPVKAAAVLPPPKEKPENVFEAYCPCTMQGHQCENPACKKIKVCSVCMRCVLFCVVRRSLTGA